MNTQNELYENASISLEDEVDLYSESPKVQDETKVAQLKEVERLKSELQGLLCFLSLP